jgi:hypothetical protein
MALTLVLPDANVGQPHARSPAFLCSATDSGSEAAWVRAGGELDHGEPPVQVLLQLAKAELASRAPPGLPRLAALPRAAR